MRGYADGQGHWFKRGRLDQWEGDVDVCTSHKETFPGKGKLLFITLEFTNYSTSARTAKGLASFQSSFWKPSTW